MQGYLRHLANFSEIGRSGSLAGAAERLGTTVSVMSRSLAILESHFGFPLVLRNARGVVPTEAGRLVLAQADAIVGAGMRALEVGRTALPVEGEVVFSAPREVLQFWLVDGLKALLRDHPGIELTVLASDQILDPRRKRLDVTLRVGSAARADDMEGLAEFSIRPVLVCHPEVAENFEKQHETRITTTVFLRFGTFGPTGPITLQAKESGRAPVEIDFTRQTVVTDVALAIALARAGAGVVGCLEPSVRSELESGSLVEVFPEYGFTPVPLRIGMPKGNQTPAAILVATEIARSLGKFLLPAS